MELTGGLWRVAILKIDYPFFKRSGTLSGQLKTEKGDLGCSKDALGRVGDNSMPLKLVERSK